MLLISIWKIKQKYLQTFLAAFAGRLMLVLMKIYQIPHIYGKIVLNKNKRQSPALIINAGLSGAMDAFVEDFLGYIRLASWKVYIQEVLIIITADN